MENSTSICKVATSIASVLQSGDAQAPLGKIASPAPSEISSELELDMRRAPGGAPCSLYNLTIPLVHGEETIEEARENE